MDNKYLNKKDITAEGIEFQPLEDNGKERFQIWDNNQRKFIKSGEKIQTEQGEQTVDRYIKLSDAEKKTLNRSLTFQRRVLVNDEEKFLELPSSAEGKLVEMMGMLKEVGGDPMEFTFIISKTGAGLDTKYTIKKGDKVGKGGVPQSTIPEPVTLGEEEKGIVDILVGSIREKNLDVKLPAVKAAYIKGLMDNGIAEARAQDIYRDYFE